MMIRSIILLLLVSCVMNGQTYLHPTTGMQNQNVGACMISTCSGTYYDNGGAAGNYSNNINGIYQTFCPNAANKCVKAAFTSFNIEGAPGCPYEYFVVENGCLQNSTALAGGCGNFGATFGTYTSTDASGCLTFRFWSDNSVNYSGWAATLSCVACAGPNGTDNNDCSNATHICTNTTFNGTSTGPGITSEGCQNGATTATDCNLSENCTNWYSFQINTSGNLVLTITPANGTDDYDFVVYGPNVSCAGLGSPIRCSYACYGGCNSPNATTGMNTTKDLVETGAAEDVNGDGWVSTLPVTSGQIYYLMINKWGGGGTGYTIDWSGSTADFTCGGALPIELIDFDAKFNGSSVNLNWSTATEINNDYFEVEKSYDGFNFSPLARVKGKGTSLVRSDYSFDDYKFSNGMVYYRIKYSNSSSKHAYSDVKGVYISLRPDFIYVYNEPGSNVAQTFFNSAGNENITINIIDIEGRSVRKENIATVAGTNQYNFDISSLEKGIYFVTISFQDKVLTGKFIKF